MNIEDQELFCIFKKWHNESKICIPYPEVLGDFSKEEYTIYLNIGDFFSYPIKNTK